MKYLKKYKFINENINNLSDDELREKLGYLVTELEELTTANIFIPKYTKIYQFLHLIIVFYFKMSM